MFLRQNALQIHKDRLDATGIGPIDLEHFIYYNLKLNLQEFTTLDYKVIV